MDVFISYRREDTSGYALGFRRAIMQHVPGSKVFLDVESMDAGVNWRRAIRDQIASCDVLLVIIGDEWLVTRDQRKKIDSDDDPVRHELAEALARDGDVHVIPVIVEEAKMPAPADLPSDVRKLCDFNTHVIHDRSYDSDLTKLLTTLGNLSTSGPAIQEASTAVPSVPAAPARASFPDRITERYLTDNVPSMDRDELVGLMALLRERGWDDKRIDDEMLSHSPLNPPSRLPARITPAWLETHVPLLTATRTRRLVRELRKRRWSDKDIRTHVLTKHLNGLADTIPARVSPRWLEENAVLMTAQQQRELATVLATRGWSADNIAASLPEAGSVLA